MHYLTPDLYDYLKASAEGFEEAFINPEVYDDLSDEIRDLRSGSRYTDMEILFGIKSDKLVKFSFDISVDYEGLTRGDEMHIDVDFYDIGKTVFDIEKLEDLLAETKQNRY